MPKADKSYAQELDAIKAKIARGDIRADDADLRYYIAYRILSLYQDDLGKKRREEVEAEIHKVAQAQPSILVRLLVNGNRKNTWTQEYILGMLEDMADQGCAEAREGIVAFGQRFVNYIRVPGKIKSKDRDSMFLRCIRRAAQSGSAASLRFLAEVVDIRDESPRSIQFRQVALESIIAQVAVEPRAIATLVYFYQKAKQSYQHRHLSENLLRVYLDALRQALSANLPKQDMCGRAAYDVPSMSMTVVISEDSAEFQSVSPNS